MGFAILILPNRPSTEAYIDLLQKTKCRELVAGSSDGKAAELIQDQYLLSVFPVLERDSYDTQKPSGLAIQALHIRIPPIVLHLSSIHQDGVYLAGHYGAYV